MATLMAYNASSSPTPMAFGGSSVFTTKRLEEMSPQEYQDYYNKVQLSFARNNELDALNPGRSKTTFGSGSSASSSGSNTSSTSSTGSLFGSLNGNFGGLVDQAKDLAQFNLGLSKDQAQFYRGLREDEAQADFGRNFKLQDQQIIGQKDLTNIQQSATTDRLQRQLDSQQTMQQRGFDQQNLFRAQSAALALRGLR